VKHTVGLPREQLRSHESRVSKFTARTGRCSEINIFFPPKLSDVIATEKISPMFVRNTIRNLEHIDLYPR